MLHTDFFRSAFGTGIESYPAEVITEENGNQWISPANERVEVDANAAEEIVGDHVISAEQTLEVCGYTITVDSYLVDDNGIGVLTYTVEKQPAKVKDNKQITANGALAYGQALSELQVSNASFVGGLGGKALAGDFAFTDADEILSAGRHDVSWIFTPA